MKLNLVTAAVRSVFTPFVGGYDSDTPALMKQPGTVRNAQNFEQSINGGYATMKGYERFSGKAAPSAGSYAMLPCSTPGSNASNGTVTLTGNDSSATGIIIAATATHLVLTAVTGVFQAENGDVGGTVITGAQVVDGASTTLLHAKYKNLAADVYRALIAAVPGSGAILGVHAFYNGTADVVYAFRNNAGDTATDLYKSAAGGWTQVALGRELSFTSGGVTEISVGDTITGATSTETAVITGVSLESGTWAAGTAAGRLIFASQSGAFQSENLDVGASSNLATIAGDSTAITLTKDGRYKMITATFGGGANTAKIYGCDGVNRGFEFDGTTFIPIATGMSADTPSHVFMHKNHLFFAFDGSAQHSGIGTPYKWTVVSGAGELAMGDTITGFMKQAGSSSEAALTIFTRNTLATLYGTGSTTWNLNHYKAEVGAIAHSTQQIGGTMMLDDRGLVQLAAVQAYGNFSDATLSQKVQSWLVTRRTLVTDSCIMRDKSQYRIFFSDKSALFVTMNGNKVVGMMPILTDDVVQCITSVENNAGSEVVYFGDGDGFVHQMEKGTSFDGDDIESFIDLAFNNFSNSRQLKAYRSATLEVTGTGYSEFQFGYELGYASADYVQPGDTTKTLSLAAGNWDSGNWDVGVWDGVALTPTRQDLRGSAENISIQIRSNADYFDSATFSGATIQYTPRRLLR